MTRTVVFVDRAATLIIALALIAVGAAMLIWNTSWFQGIPDSVTAPGLVTASRTGWWPWAVTGTGIILVVVALRWLISHRRAARIGRTMLGNHSGSEIPGRSSSDVGALASAAAQALAADPAITAASGKAVVDRRRRTLDLIATAASPDVLADAVRAADRTAREAITVIGDDTLATRTLIRIDRPRGRDRHLT